MTEATPAGTIRAQRVAMIALLAGAAAIAFAPLFVRISELGPSATAFHRLALALPLLWLWTGIAPPSAPYRRPQSVRDFRWLALAGLCFACDLALWHWSIRLTSIANATLMANFAPLFVTFGVWMAGQRVTPLFLAGLGLGLTGAALLMGASLSVGWERLLGDALGIGAALFYASYLLTVHRLRTEFPTQVIMAWSGSVTALLLLPVALLSGESLLPVTMAGWSILIGLAWLSHFGGQSLITYSLAHLPAAFSSVGLLLQPVLAAALAWLLLGEALGPLQALGGAVVLVGIALARRGS